MGLIHLEAHYVMNKIHNMLLHIFSIKCYSGHVVMQEKSYHGEPTSSSQNSSFCLQMNTRDSWYHGITFFVTILIHKKSICHDHKSAWYFFESLLERWSDYIRWFMPGINRDFTEFFYSLVVLKVVFTVSGKPLVLCLHEHVMQWQIILTHVLT